MRSFKDARYLVAIVFLWSMLASLPAYSQLHGGWAPPPTGPGIEQPLPSPNLIVNSKPVADNAPLKFTSRTDMVLVPVVVRDRSGRHIPHLEKEDFAVIENGEDQRIASFEEVVPRAATAPRPNQVTPFTYTNAAEDQSPRQLVIIALDAVNTPFLDQTRAREQLVRYLADSIHGEPLITLLAVDHKGVHVIHDFTTDSSVLMAALAKVKSEFRALDTAPTPRDLATETSVPRQAASLDEVTEIDRLRAFAHMDADYANYQRANAMVDTMNALQYIARAFSSLPGRKALLWATGSFPFALTDESGRVSVSGVPSVLYEYTFQALNQANIAVYPVDVRGLSNLSVANAVIGDERVDINSTTRQLDAEMSTHAASISTLETFAQMTGGKAFYNRNDLAASFNEATQDSSAYYMLGYYLNHSNTKPGWRKLSVKVKRDDARVRARSGFFVSNNTLNPSINRQYDLVLAVQSPFDYTALPLTVQWVSSQKDGDKRKVGFQVLLAKNSATIDEADKNKYDLDFAVVAKDPEGKQAGQVSQTIGGHLKPEHVAQIRESGITYSNQLELKPGTYHVRVVVRDNLSGKIGSLSAPLALK